MGSILSSEIWGACVVDIVKFDVPDDVGENEEEEGGGGGGEAGTILIPRTSLNDSF